MGVGKDKTTEGKEPKRCHKNQRPTYSHAQESHKKTTNLETIIHMQRTCCTLYVCNPMHASSVSVSSYEH